MRSGKTVDTGFQLNHDDDDDVQEYTEPKSIFSLQACFPSFSVPKISFCSSSSAYTQSVEPVHPAVDSMEMVDEETDNIEGWLGETEFCEFDPQVFDWSGPGVLQISDRPRVTHNMEIFCRFCSTKEIIEVSISDNDSDTFVEFTCSVCNQLQTLLVEPSLSNKDVDGEDVKSTTTATTHASSLYSDLDSRIVDISAGRQSSGGGSSCFGGQSTTRKTNL
jgi:hypothetical protein